MSDIGARAGKVGGAGSIQKAPKPEENQTPPQEAPLSSGVFQEPEQSADRGAFEKAPAAGEDPLPPPPEPSKLPEFDPNRTADARADSKEPEGGRYVARTTGASAMDNKLATDPIGLTQPEDPKEKDLFELHGFKVQYTIPGTKDIASASVRVFFKSMNQIRNAISWNTYKHKMANGLILETTITEGLPLVACNDAIKYRYTVEKKWRRGA
jgi:hypothetical protein